jgi:hypothetical protein
MTPKWVDQVLKIAKYKPAINKGSFYKDVMKKFKTAKCVSVHIGPLGAAKCVLYKKNGRVQVVVK